LLSLCLGRIESGLAFGAAAFGFASVDSLLGMMILVGERREWLKPELHLAIAL
jgi:hypothetical protein